VPRPPAESGLVDAPQLAGARGKLPRIHLARTMESSASLEYSTTVARAELCGSKRSREDADIHRPRHRRLPIRAPLAETAPPSTVLSRSRRGRWQDGHTAPGRRPAGSSLPRSHAARHEWFADLRVHSALTATRRCPHPRHQCSRPSGRPRRRRAGGCLGVSGQAVRVERLRCRSISPARASPSTQDEVTPRKLPS
jgi:hypothetical protein